MIVTTRILVATLVFGHLATTRSPDGNAEISGEHRGSRIVIKTTDRLAGAIDSLTWDGVEFIDSADHGRQLQSASNFDAGAEFHPEVFNPTEAGSRRDGAGSKSTSRLVSIEAGGNRLKTRSRMAFWLRPGEKSNGHPATNSTELSNHYLEKTVRVGHGGLPNVLVYDVVFEVPGGEGHRQAQFESLTGYMPPQFSKFQRFERSSGRLLPLDDGPGEQADPVVFSTPDGRRAMGIISPDPRPAGFAKVGYGRFRFEAERVVKWNCVSRLRNPRGVPAGRYSFRHFVPIGTLEDVRLALVNLSRDSGLQPAKPSE